MVQSLTYEDVLYPDSDGKPMAENTLQYQWIVRLVSNLRHLLRDQTAFVAGDLLWYPVQVSVPPVPCLAPDVLVALGRPVGERGSYKQWQEDNIAPQVVFEILSPSNTPAEMREKQDFYNRHGVLEYYVYNPDTYEFWGLVRNASTQKPMPIFPLKMPWVSPLLGIRFELFEDGLAVFYPNGEPFETPTEVMADRQQIRSQYNQVEAERDQAQQERDQVQQERDQAQQERDQVQQERDRLAAKLRELGIDPTQI